MQDREYFVSEKRKELVVVERDADRRREGGKRERVEFPYISDRLGLLKQSSHVYTARQKVSLSQRQTGGPSRHRNRLSGDQSDIETG